MGSQCTSERPAHSSEALFTFAFAASLPLRKRHVDFPVLVAKQEGTEAHRLRHGVAGFPVDAEDEQNSARKADCIHMFDRHDCCTFTERDYEVGNRETFKLPTKVSTCACEMLTLLPGDERRHRSPAVGEKFSLLVQRWRRCVENSRAACRLRAVIGLELRPGMSTFNLGVQLARFGAGAIVRVPADNPLVEIRPGHARIQYPELGVHIMGREIWGGSYGNQSSSECLGYTAPRPNTCARSPVKFSKLTNKQPQTGKQETWVHRDLWQTFSNQQRTAQTELVRDPGNRSKPGLADIDAYWHTSREMY
ncbi:hypothetical protein B0H17DRAFT_1264987 [Mycena rosella]|uniref:Uncharacterized protein n=1 Tax=Mycena rosella TaxID=1033263 RepID=A0AAD7DTM1_MYCRO|nr:hypothetical protein B0H17DRAFT_1264987 [Mycena rosella]